MYNFVLYKCVVKSAIKREVFDTFFNTYIKKNGIEFDKICRFGSFDFRT